jgi:hypothetical protein
MQVDNFSQTANTVAVNASAVSSSVPLADSKTGSDDRDYRIRNTGTVDVFIVFGGSDVAAVIPAVGSPANGIPIGAGHTEAFRAPAGNTHLAAITASGTATLYITTGRGL